MAKVADGDTQRLINQQAQSTANNTAMQIAARKAMDEQSREQFLTNMQEAEAKNRKGNSESYKGLV